MRQHLAASISNLKYCMLLGVLLANFASSVIYAYCKYEG